MKDDTKNHCQENQEVRAKMSKFRSKMSKILEFRKRAYDILVLNKKRKTHLGTISYHEGWKEPVFTPVSEKVIFSVECLQDIIYIMRINKGNGDDDDG